MMRGVLELLLSAEPEAQARKFPEEFVVFPSMSGARGAAASSTMRTRGLPDTRRPFAKSAA